MVFVRMAVKIYINEPSKAFFFFFLACVGGKSA